MGLIALVNPTAITLLGAFCGFLIATTQSGEAVKQNTSRIEVMERQLSARSGFMECAIREIDRIDIQSKDPDAKAIRPRCDLVMPLPATR